MTHLHRAMNAFFSIVIFSIGSNAFAQDAVTVTPSVCGSIHAKVHAVALADNDGGAHQETLDRTWVIPAGVHSAYGSRADGWIVTQGWPSNGGAHSHELLTTECAARLQDPNSQTVSLKLKALSDLASGVGRGTGASSDFDTDWFLTAILPSTPGNKGWTLTAVGVVNGSNTTPKCSIRINDGAGTALSTGPFIKTFAGLSGLVAVFVSCSQGHIAIFPTGPRMTTAIVTVETDVTLAFSRTQ